MTLSILEDYFGSWYLEHGRTLNLDEIHDDVAEPTHPLHDRYEWDDEKAGREYRKMQIARDIRSVERIFTKGDGSIESTRAYWANRDIGHGTSGYSSVEDALQDPEVLSFLKKSMLMEMRSMERRFGHLEEYYDVLQEQLKQQREKRRRSSPRKAAQPRSNARKPRKRV